MPDGLSNSESHIRIQDVDEEESVTPAGTSIEKKAAKIKGHRSRKTIATGGGSINSPTDSVSKLRKARQKNRRSSGALGEGTSSPAIQAGANLGNRLRQDPSVQDFKTIDQLSQGASPTWGEHQLELESQSLSL